MPCSFIEAACSVSSRIASRPPCTFGCSVFTRPSIISGKPVRSETSRTFRPASAIALAVPPVETSSMPCSLSARANSISPVLSETESSARVMRRRSVMRSFVMARAGGAFGKRGRSSRPQHYSGSCGSSRSARRTRFLRVLMGEGPVHARHVARVAVDHDLHGAARPVGPGEIDAFLKLHPLLVGVEGPHFACSAAPA